MNLYSPVLTPFARGVCHGEHKAACNTRRRVSTPPAAVVHRVVRNALLLATTLSVCSPFLSL